MGRNFAIYIPCKTLQILYLMKLYSLSNIYLRLVLQILYMKYVRGKVGTYGLTYVIFIVYRSFAFKEYARAIKAQSLLNHITILRPLSNKAYNMK